MFPESVGAAVKSMTQRGQPNTVSGREMSLLGEKKPDKSSLVLIVSNIPKEG